MKYKVIFDRNKCEDNMVCVAECPKFWKLDSSTGRVYLKGAEETSDKIFELEIDEKDYECNKKAAAGCPKGAIMIKEVK
jgi:ferredoxin